MASGLILIGFMGSGKSAVGSRVAQILGWNMVDTDEQVEKELGIPISEIFRTRGEKGFRQAEQSVVIRLLEEAEKSGAQMVLSLGGGALTNAEVYERLQAEPLVVLLDTDLDTAFDRAQGGQRPLARDPEGFKELYREREELYRGAAKIIVDTRGKDIHEIASEVAAMVEERKSAG